MKTAMFALVACLMWAQAQAQAACAVQGAGGAAPVVTLTITPPTLDTDGVTPVATPLSYQIWQGTAAGAETLAATVTSTVNTIKTGLLSGKTYYYKVAVVDANGSVGALSAEGCKFFPNGIPGTVTFTIS